MTHFSETLGTTIAATGKTLSEVGERTKIDQSLLSRMTAARDPMAPTARNLVKLGKMFPISSPAGQELIFAHLRDVAASAGLAPADLRLTIDTGAPDLRASLPLQLQADLDLLASESLVNDDFAKLVADWAAIIRGHQVALQKKVYPFPARESKKVAEPKGKWPGAPGGASQVPPA